MKYVSDSAAAKQLAVYIILNNNGDRVGKVLAHFGKGGTCTVNVFDSSKGLDGFQRKTAGGYGYDKLAACLNGCTIDGHTLVDHCCRDDAAKGYMEMYREAAVSCFSEPAIADVILIARRNGYRFYNTAPGGGYNDCYRLGGLDYLKAIGYTVIQAL